MPIVYVSSNPTVSIKKIASRQTGIANIDIELDCSLFNRRLRLVRL